MSIFEKFVKVIQPWIFAARYPGLKVQIEPQTRVLFEQLRSTSAVVCPNHCRHEDGELLFLISILIKQQFKFLAAREMFDSYGGFGGIVLRELGCFQVDRGGDNSDAIRATEHQLTGDGAKVVIFPEGEIGYDNDRLESLEPGAAAIGLDTFIRFQHHGQERPVSIVPLALSYQFDNAPVLCEKLLDRLESKLRLPHNPLLPNALSPVALFPPTSSSSMDSPLAQSSPTQSAPTQSSLTSLSLSSSSGDAPPNAVSLHDRARRIVEAFLDDREKELESWFDIHSPVDGSDIDARVARVFSASLQRIADLVDYKIPHGSETHRLHHLQSKIFVRKLKAGFFEKSKFAQMEKQTILLNRLRSIRADEIDGTSSINSLADLLCSLDVLITGRASPGASRTVMVNAAEPLDMSAYAALWREDREAAVSKITEELRERLQGKLFLVRSAQDFLDSGGSNLTLRNSM